MSGTQAYTTLSSATPAPGALAMPTVAGLPRPHQTGNAEHRVGEEHLGIHEEIVDASIDHVDAFESLDRLHVDAVVVADDEVLTLDELGAHPLREERVLEVRRVVDARCQHGDARVRTVIGGERHQEPIQLVGVRVDGPDAVPLEQLGKRPLRDRTVLQDVAHARRHPQVVLEHVQLAVAGAHEIRAGDVRPDTELRMDASTLGPEVRGVVEQVRREHAVRDDPAVVVDVVDEVVQRSEPLGEAAFHHAPLVTVDQARDDVERPRPVDVRSVGVDRERDPHRQDLEVGHPLAFADLVEADAMQQLDEVPRDRSRTAVVLEQFVHEC